MLDQVFRLNHDFLSLSESKSMHSLAVLIEICVNQISWNIVHAYSITNPSPSETYLRKLMPTAVFPIGIQHKILSNSEPSLTP